MQEFLEKIEPYRQKIDQIDKKIIGLLAERMNISSEIGVLKQDENVPMRQPERKQQVIAARILIGNVLHLNETFIKKLFQLIMDESCRVQEIL